MAKPHRMTPARRAALRKAQLASARKRRGHGRGKLAAANRRFDARTRRNRRIAIGVVAGVGAAAIAGHATRTHLRENALKAKHGEGYIPRKVTGYHHTYRQHQRTILRTQKFTTKERFHGGQKRGEVWFTTGKNERGRMGLYGDYVVKVRVKRRHIAQHHPGWATTGHKGHNAWFSVHQNNLHGRRIRHHYSPRANPIRGTRATRARARRIRR